MRRNEYLQMLYQDNETEEENKKELYAAVLECTVEALSQENDDFDADQSIGLHELYQLIEAEGRKKGVVSPFRAAELIAEKLGAKYKRPIERFAHLFKKVSAAPSHRRLEDLL